MKKPLVTPAEMWAAQAQFGPFDIEVIQEILDEWAKWRAYQGLKAMQDHPGWDPNMEKELI